MILFCFVFYCRFLLLFFVVVFFCVCVCFCCVAVAVVFECGKALGSSTKLGTFNCKGQRREPF